MVFDAPPVGLIASRGNDQGGLMLKIQRVEKDEQVRLALSGRIEAAHVAELRRLIDDESRHRAITLDLKEVQLVDRDTVMFLARCESAGITLENACSYVREWIAREERWNSKSSNQA